MGAELREWPHLVVFVGIERENLRKIDDFESTRDPKKEFVL